MAGAAPAAAAGSLPNEAPGRILVADDEPSILRACARVLAGAGHAVETAADGAEAADRIERESFDVIVSDIAMP